MKPEIFAKKFPTRHVVIERRIEYFQRCRPRDTRVKELESEGWEVEWDNRWVKPYSGRGNRLWVLEAERITEEKETEADEPEPLKEE